MADEQELNRLTRRAVFAEISCRDSLAASLYGRAERAEAAAEAQRGEVDSLVLAHLRICRAYSLSHLEQADGDAVTLRLEAWALVKSVADVVERRARSGTLVRLPEASLDSLRPSSDLSSAPVDAIPSQMPGCVREEEAAFYWEYKDAVRDATGKPLLSVRFLVAARDFIGVGVLLAAARAVLYRMFNSPALSASEQRKAEAAVLGAVDTMLRASCFLPHDHLSEEEDFVDAIERVLGEEGPRNHPSFRSALRAKTGPSTPFHRMLVARGLTNALASADASRRVFEANRRADVAAHGLRRCAFPFCDKREATVMQFKFCAACRSEWYCSEEHGALHWKAHRPVCRETTAAKQAVVPPVE